MLDSEIGATEGLGPPCPSEDKNVGAVAWSHKDVAIDARRIDARAGSGGSLEEWASNNPTLAWTFRDRT